MKNEPCISCGKPLSLCRGLCYNRCYQKARQLVARGETTWRDLEDAGKARPLKSEQGLAQRDMRTKAVAALPVDANEWTVEDWRDLHEAIEQVKRRVAERHATGGQR